MIRWIALDSCALMPFDIAGSTAGSSQNFASPLAHTTCTWTRASSREKKNRYGPSLNTVGLTCVSILKVSCSRSITVMVAHVGLVGEAKAGDHRSLDALAGGQHLLRHPQRLAAVHLPGCPDERRPLRRRVDDEPRIDRDAVAADARTRCARRSHGTGRGRTPATGSPPLSARNSRPARDRARAASAPR